jgi:hypothetical protein
MLVRLRLSWSKEWTQDDRFQRGRTGSSKGAEMGQRVLELWTEKNWSEFEISAVVHFSVGITLCWSREKVREQNWYLFGAQEVPDTLDVTLYYTATVCRRGFRGGDWHSESLRNLTLVCLLCLNSSLCLFIKPCAFLWNPCIFWHL